MLENVSVPPEVEQAIDKRSSMGAVGNLNDYVKFQMGSAMGAGGEGGRAAAVPAQMAMGFGMAQEMMKRMAAQRAAQPAGGPGAPSPAASTCSTPEQAAQALGVSVEDVMASIDAGRTQGPQDRQRVPHRARALDEFLRG